MSDEQGSATYAGAATGLDEILDRIERLRPLIAQEREQLVINEREYADILGRLNGHIAEHERLREKAERILAERDRVEAER